MPVNADKPYLWKDDIAKSVDRFNAWFLRFAPKAYRDTRAKVTREVEQALVRSADLTVLTSATLKANPSILPTLRMCCCPPIARDRLIGLAGVNRSLVGTLENGLLPARMPAAALDAALERMLGTVSRMLDVDIFPWLTAKRVATRLERYRASTIVADRRCGAVSDPIVRNAQEKRQLDYIAAYLKKKTYKVMRPRPGMPLTDMEPGTFTFRMNVLVGKDRRITIPVDVVIQPKLRKPGTFPLLIEAKSAGDFTNVNKRRKEEATKMRQLRETYGPDVRYVLFLCGYFDAGYLGYEAAEGIDWVWEHRIKDLDRLGI